VELSLPAHAAIRANVDALGVADRVKVHRGDAMRLVARLSAQPYDVVVADPPWSMPHAAALVERFRAEPFARVLSVEHPASREVPGDDTRRYGDTAITFSYAP
jgi:16S rRNA (guanine966-N2)-methyltransferase